MLRRADPSPRARRRRVGARPRQHHRLAKGGGARWPRRHPGDDVGLRHGHQGLRFHAARGPRFRAPRRADIRAGKGHHRVSSPASSCSPSQPERRSSSSPITQPVRCSMDRKSHGLPKELLSKNGFVVKDVPESHLCCGSAGTYNILQPDIASRLRDRKVANIATVKPDMIAAGNIGCMVQIAGGTSVPVVHTIELLDWATGGPKPGLKARIELIDRPSGMNRDRRAPVFLGINAQRLTRDHAQTEEWSRRTLRRNVVPIQLRGIVKRSTDRTSRLDQRTWPTDLDQRQTGGSRWLRRRRVRRRKKAKKAKKAVTAKKPQEVLEEGRQEICKEIREEVGQEVREEVCEEGRQEIAKKAAAPKKAAKKSPAKKRKAAAPEACAGPDGSSGAGARAGASPELGYPEFGALDPVMGIRLVQRRRPALADRLQNEFQRPQRPSLRPFSRGAVEVTGSRRFTGRFDSQNPLFDGVLSAGFRRFHCLHGDAETAKNVMGMQHPPTTFLKRLERLKRRHMLAFFASRLVTRRTRLQTR